MTTEFIQPLDLYNILVNALSGSQIIFAVLGIVFIAIMSAKFKLSGIGLMIMIGLFSVIVLSDSVIGYMIAILVIVGVGFAMLRSIKN
jgi:hypothetical protein